jgi:hypothetical protein
MLVGGNCASDGGGGTSYISGYTGCVAITSATDTTPKSGCTTVTVSTTQYGNCKIGVLCVSNDGV